MINDDRRKQPFLTGVLIDLERGLEVPASSPFADGDGDDVPTLELSNSSLLLAGEGTAVVEALCAGLLRPFSTAFLVAGEARLVTELEVDGAGVMRVGGTSGPAIILKGDGWVPYFASARKVTMINCEPWFVWRWSGHTCFSS